MISKIAQNVAQSLGNFYYKNVSKRPLKVAQSGHTFRGHTFIGSIFCAAVAASKTDIITSLKVIGERENAQKLLLLPT